MIYDIINIIVNSLLIDCYEEKNVGDVRNIFFHQVCSRAEQEEVVAALKHSLQTGDPGPINSDDSERLQRFTAPKNSSIARWVAKSHVSLACFQPKVEVASLSRFFSAPVSGFMAHLELERQLWPLGPRHVMFLASALSGANRGSSFDETIFWTRMAIKSQGLKGHCSALQCIAVN